ncbi:MAG TPA: proton-conducting transporter membrane subunit [Candidatus Kryptonia bacterium]|nr:proton-conducting transporter membrane subunit [Candidatus Kryptonia bacterium]
MLLLLGATVLLVASGFAAVTIQQSPRWCNAVGASGAVAGCLLGLLSALRALLGASDSSLRLAWEVPGGAFFVQMDALSAFFLFPILGLSALAAVYGSEYLRHYQQRKWLGPPWFFFNLLVASMVLVVVARNGVLFLIAWEVMALASFFLVTFDDESVEVREAGWTYLVATHVGTAFLLAFFVLAGRASGSLDFDRLSVAPTEASLLFLLAVVGFGTKAGFAPFHVWLPEAHPAAPSHVSAVMSGVMLKTGIYGLVRTLTILASPPAWWGWLLCGIGLVSGIGGVLFALAQRDVKRMLAYSSVENIGIIALGLGIGVLGVATGVPALAVLGFAGGLLHVVNHAVVKGLLFLAAGSVAHATGTRDIERLGGAMKRMPYTGAVFLIAAIAICGLPPLNGFVSEWLIFLGALHGSISPGRSAAIPVLAVIGGLALIGGLAAACFTRAFGVVFLGTARSDHVTRAHEPGLAMRLPMLLLAAGCVLIGSFAPLLVGGLAPVIASATGLQTPQVATHLVSATRPLQYVVWSALGLLVVVALLAGLRRALLADRRAEVGLTWDCGYVQPSARMQYTASSFAQPLMHLFGVLLQTQQRTVTPAGFFPRAASLITKTPDVCAERLYQPAFRGIGRGLSSLRWLQHGRVHLYVLYIAVTLLVLLVWKLG